MFSCRACLRIFDSLYFYLNSLNQHENGLLFIIGSIYSYYQRFQKQINDHVLNLIVEQQSFSFLKGACKAENYIEHFPFPYYVILKSVSDLPAILGDSLRQRFEMINMH